MYSFRVTETLTVTKLCVTLTVIIKQKPVHGRFTKDLRNKESKHATEENDQDFPGGPGVRNPPANAGDVDSTLLREDPTCRGPAPPVGHNYRAHPATPDA